MAAVKTVAARSSLPIARPAPSRSLASPVHQTWLLRGREEQDEQELLERILEICQEYAQSRASQVSINHYQVLPPEAVSIIDPPERAWLVRLYLVGYEPDPTPGHVEIIAVLRSGEVGVMLR